MAILVRLVSRLSPNHCRLAMPSPVRYNTNYSNGDRGRDMKSIRLFIVILGICLLAGCTRTEQFAQLPVPSSYEEAIEMLADENDVALTDEEADLIKSNAVADKAALETLGETAEDLEQEYRLELLGQKLRDALFPDVTATGEEVSGWYNARLAALTSAFEKDPGLYKNQQESYELYGGVPPLLIPEGYIRFHHILVEDEVLAMELRGRLESGEDFAALLGEYGQDSAMRDEPYATLGYLASPYPATRDYLDELKEAALALEAPGDISDVVSSSAGYHIVRLARKVEPRTLPLGEVEGAIGTLLTANKQQQALDALIDERMNG